MTLDAFAERITNLVSSFTTDENRFDRPYIYSLIHSATAQAKRAEFARTKRIHADWWVRYIPEFNEAAQISSCYYRFKLPQLIALDPRMTGVGYIGSIECNKQFRVVEGRGKFAAMQNHKVMKARGNTVLLANGFLELYGNAQSMLVECLPFDPTEIATYNAEKDPYPVEASLVPEVEKIIVQTNLMMISKSAIDKFQNFQDDSAISK